VRNHILYDQLILEEVVKRAQDETGHQKVITAGCSFGGYQAVNFAFRHPDVVEHTFSMGGAFDIKMHLDGHYDDNVYFNNPPDFIPSLENPELKKMGIVLGVGEHDFCIAQNKRLSDILTSKGIHHWLDIREGANHDWPVWREMFPAYLGLLKYN
jgi:esterase/lipase superfamily enzyme